MQKAQQLGTKIIFEDEFLSMLDVSEMATDNLSESENTNELSEDENKHRKDILKSTEVYSSTADITNKNDSGKDSSQMQFDF